MKAVAVFPNGGASHSNLIEIDKPSASDAGPRGVLVRVMNFVLGNKVMVGTVNAAREHFELGVSDFARARLTWPDWLAELLTHPVRGLERYRELIETLTAGTDVIKAYCEVSA